MLGNLSYRVKTPLAMSLVIILTAAAVAGALAWQGYRQARAGFIQHAQVLGKTLARTVRPALIHDDVWQAYEMLITPLERSGDTGRVLVLLDAHGRVFAATEPRQFGVLDDFSVASRDTTVTSALRGLAHADKHALGQTTVLDHDPGLLYFLTPVLAEDGTKLGLLVQRYNQALLGPRLQEVGVGTVYAALAALVLLLPLGWLAGKRLAEPLSHLAHCLTRVGKELPERIQCTFPSGRDEIGQLATRFQDMVGELHAKQALERHLAQSDRLAAVGRLSAGIAHEINNPLGGMLNAISNYRRRGGTDPHADKTLALIERGLTQIRETVSALLVETKLEARALTPDDLEDVRTLVSADIQKKRLALSWDNGITEPLPLPSAQIRQILLNLLLNATQASPEDGEVSCRLEAKSNDLSVSVGNAGPAIPERRRQHLFEPYFGEGEVHGLGLWVTYQLVTQLGGTIRIDSVPGYTRFNVDIPMEAGNAT
jgi:signal transduction histidine kinase